MTHTTFRILLAFVAIALVATAPAWAGSATYESRYEDMDTNEDDHVDHDEFIANYEGPDQEEAFKKIDTNKSHTVSMEEWLQYNEAEDEKRFKEMDTNTDMKVDEAEYGVKYSHKKDKFKDIDKDMSGTLDENEWKEYKRDHDLGEYHN